MKIRVAIAFFVIMAATVQVRAETVDLRKMKCDEFLKTDAQTADRIGTWLDGWSTEDKGPLVINTQEIAKGTKELRDYCTKNPGHGLLKAVDEVFD